MEILSKIRAKWLMQCNKGFFKHAHVYVHTHLLAAIPYYFYYFFLSCHWLAAVSQSLNTPLLSALFKRCTVRTHRQTGRQAQTDHSHRQEQTM